MHIDFAPRLKHADEAAKKAAQRELLTEILQLQPNAHQQVRPLDLDQSSPENKAKVQQLTEQFNELKQKNDTDMQNFKNEQAQMIKDHQDQTDKLKTSLDSGGGGGGFSQNALGAIGGVIDKVGRLIGLL